MLPILDQKKVAFIGAGSMAEGMISGMVRAKKIHPDRLKKLATQKVSKKEYTQEELNELKKDYRVFNDTLYRAYIDGDTIVKIEPAYT
ncbi:NAD(P)-binding domain-containing protein [Bacillus paralicheniformis]|uniref:NAD(P)-binding domain-containing protein n=1 Tax=Bacillus paralicheniformis TaxID=1648923 RepID=UPI003BF9E7D2